MAVNRFNKGDKGLTRDGKVTGTGRGYVSPGGGEKDMGGKGSSRAKSTTKDQSRAPAYRKGGLVKKRGKK